MADAPGSNDSKNLKGLTKQTYAKKIVNAVPGGKFNKLKKLLKFK